MTYSSCPLQFTKHLWFGLSRLVITSIFLILDALIDYGRFENRQGFLQALRDGIVCVSNGIDNPIGKTSLEHFEEEGIVSVLDLPECEDLRASYTFKFI